MSCRLFMDDLFITNLNNPYVLQVVHLEGPGRRAKPKFLLLLIFSALKSQSKCQSSQIRLVDGLRAPSPVVLLEGLVYNSVITIAAIFTNFSKMTHDHDICYMYILNCLIGHNWILLQNYHRNNPDPYLLKSDDIKLIKLNVPMLFTHF